MGDSFGSIQGAGVDMQILAFFGPIVTFLGYRLMVGIGDSVRRDPIANASFDSGNTGCGLVGIAWIMMIGGVGLFLYACIQYWKATP